MKYTAGDIEVLIGRIIIITTLLILNLSTPDAKLSACLLVLQLGYMIAVVTRFDIKMLNKLLDK